MGSETYTQAPTDVVDKARRLADQGNYKEALDLLQRHSVVFEIYPVRGEMVMKLPSNRQRPKSRTKKGGSR